MLPAGPIRPYSQTKSAAGSVPLSKKASIAVSMHSEPS